MEKESIKKLLQWCPFCYKEFLENEKHRCKLDNKTEAIIKEKGPEKSK